MDLIFLLVASYAVWWVLKKFVLAADNVISRHLDVESTEGTYYDLVRSYKGEYSLYNDAPFQLKRNEKYITGVNATINLWKNTGRGGYHGITVSIPIMKGVRYRAGGGRIGMEKAWVADQQGTLHFTTDRVVFNGNNKNFSVRWDKVIGLSTDSNGTAIVIDRESGNDWAFALHNQLPVSAMATIFTVEENRL